MCTTAPDLQGQAKRGRVGMAGPEGGSSGKGKGKGKSRDGGGSSTARGERTPSPNRSGSRTSGVRSLALRLCSSAGAGDVEAPRPKTVCAFAVVVSALALLRHALLPVSICLCRHVAYCRWYVSVVMQQTLSFVLAPPPL